MNTPFNRFIMLALVVAGYINACQSAPPQAQVSDFEINGNGKTGGSGDNPHATEVADESTLKRVHPKASTAWSTKKLVLTSPQPTAARISECQERVESAVKDAPNLNAMDEAALSIETTVGHELSLYHWCFYQMMADLDQRLDLDTPLMEDKGLLFFARMKTMWTLARALDTVSGGSRYMVYLKTRYTDLSQSVFGRNLESQDFDTFRSTANGHGSNLNDATHPKPAAQFDE